jgi:hypothetical protein
LANLLQSRKNRNCTSAKAGALLQFDLELCLLASLIERIDDDAYDRNCGGHNDQEYKG